MQLTSLMKDTTQAITHSFADQNNYNIFFFGKLKTLGNTPITLI